MRKPFYRSDRKKWFVVGANGKFIPLHEDEEEAYRIWNQMLEQSRRPGDPRLTVAALASRFLKEQEVLLKPPRYDLLERYLCAFSAEHGEKRCSDITKGIPAHLRHQCDDGWPLNGGSRDTLRAHRYADG